MCGKSQLSQDPVFFCFASLLRSWIITKGTKVYKLSESKTWMVFSRELAWFCLHSYQFDCVGHFFKTAPSINLTPKKPLFSAKWLHIPDWTCSIFSVGSDTWFPISKQSYIWYVSLVSMLDTVYPIMLQTTNSQNAWKHLKGDSKSYYAQLIFKMVVQQRNKELCVYFSPYSVIWWFSSVFILTCSWNRFALLCLDLEFLKGYRHISGFMHIPNAKCDQQNLTLRHL